MSQKKILVIDFDLTILTQNNPRELLEENIHLLLEKANSNGILVFISSRNPPFIVHDNLKKYNLSKFFKKIIVDYRPKSYHIKQILWELKIERIEQLYVVFVDDFLENCIIVSKLSENLCVKTFSIRYKKRYPNNLENIIDLMIENDYYSLGNIGI